MLCINSCFKIEINESSSSESSSKYAPKYYSIDWSKASEDWKYLLCGNYDGDCMYCTVLHVASTLKWYGVLNKPFITAYGVSIGSNVAIKAFSFFLFVLS